MYTQPVKRNKDYDVLLATLSTAVRAMGFIKKSKKINYPKIKTQIFVTFEWTDYFSAKPGVKKMI